MENFMFVTTVLKLCSPANQLLVAEQEKALRKEEFELSRRRLMCASQKVQELKTQIHYSERGVSH